MNYEQAFNTLMQIDGIVERIANKTATEADLRAFELLMPYELDAYLTFCETRLEMVNEEIERRGKQEQP